MIVENFAWINVLSQNRLSKRKIVGFLPKWPKLMKAKIESWPFFGDTCIFSIKN